MIKYLELLLELLRTKNEENFTETKKLFLTTGKKIEERGTKDLKVYHRYGFIFLAYEDLLNNRISLDEFLAIGDITSSKKLISNNINSLTFLHNIINRYSNTKFTNSLVILDSISFQTLSKSEKSSIQNRTKEHNNELILC